MLEADKEQLREVIAFAIGADVANVTVANYPFVINGNNGTNGNGNTINRGGSVDWTVYIILLLGLLVLALLIVAILTSNAKKKKRAKARAKAAAAQAAAAQGRRNLPLSALSLSLSRTKNSTYSTLTNMTTSQRVRFSRRKSRISHAQIPMSLPSSYVL